MQKIKVLVADDHWIVRQGIRSLFVGSDEVEVVGEAGDGREAVEQVSRLAPDVVLMDLAMPTMGGVEAIRTIHASRPQTRIVVLTASGTETEIFAAVREGALGYLEKNSGPEECLRAIRQVGRGEPWLPPALTRRLLQKLRQGDHSGPGPEHLTRRETEVLRLIAGGLDDREIGRALHVSKGTVRTHVSNVLGKLGLKNRVEATLYALRHGLASLAGIGAYGIGVPMAAHRSRICSAQAAASSGVITSANGGRLALACGDSLSQSIASQ